MSGPKSRQGRVEGRRSPMVNVTLTTGHLARLDAIVATMGETRSAAIRRMIDREHAWLGLDAARIEVAKSAGGWVVARHSPAGLELLSEHKTRRAAERAADEARAAGD